MALPVREESKKMRKGKIPVRTGMEAEDFCLFVLVFDKEKQETRSINCTIDTVLQPRN